MAITAVIELATSEFLPFGHELGAGYLLVTVPRNPDPAREKYSGDPASPIVAKSAPEITATVDAAKDAELTSVFDNVKALKAVAISNLAARLGKAPSALTPADLSAERTRILNIYKAL